MELDRFAIQIQEMYQRVMALQRQVTDAPLQQPLIVEQAFEELQTGLEELRAAEEQLQQQNIELLTAQEALVAERQRYQDLFDFAPDGYLLTTARGIIHEANHAAGRLLNIPREYVLGKPLSIFVVAGERQDFRTKLNQLRHGDRVQDWEVRLQPLKATPFPAALTAATVRDRAGHVVGIRWMLRDITEQKQAEEQIRTLNAELEQRVVERTAELEAANRLKDDLLLREQQARYVAEAALHTRDAFLNTASHELKTPLTSLVAYSHILRQIATSKPDPSVQEQRALQVILHQSQRLNALVEALLDLSRLQLGKLTIQRQPVDVGGLTQRMVEEFGLMLERHSITLSATDEPLLIDGDQLRLEQVLQNLLQNAVKYSPAGGPIVVQVQRQGDQAVISVRDQGIGIPATDQVHIFERFYRASNVNAMQISGFGIGLYVASEIIALHGGTLEVTSSEGQGSTFTIRLPCATVDHHFGQEGAH